MSKQTVINTPETKQPESTALLYRTIWRWHFYAGLLCIPFVITLSLSGLVYLFKPQIDSWIDRPFHQLNIGEKRSTANAQIDTALDALPDSRFLKYTVPESQNHAVVVDVTDSSGSRTLVYLNPYTLDVLKVIPYDKQFIRIVRNFHGELLAGNAGSVLIELAGNWAIVLILTGLYLWWPKQNKGFAGTLYPRLSLKGRPFWKDLHSVLGIWVSFFALFLLLTGLPWTLVWNSAFKEARAWLDGPQPVQEWTISRDQERSMNLVESSDAVFLGEDVLASAKTLGLAAPAELSMDAARPGFWKLASDNQNRLLRTQAWIDASTGDVAEIKPYADRKPLDVAIGIGISAHEGQLFGWFNQLLGAFTAIAILLISFSGFMMWRKRKPADELGAPVRAHQNPHEKPVTIIILIAAIFLPLLAISIIAILLFEVLLFRRLPFVKHWLGLQTS